MAPLDTELALLQEKTAGLTPFAPPRHAAAPNQVRLQDWVDVRVMGGTSPWNDGSVSLSIARSGYLLRAGHLFRISPKLASRVLERLPLY